MVKTLWICLPFHYISYPFPTCHFVACLFAWVRIDMPFPVPALKKPKRRLSLDSKECPLNMANSTAFGKHWFLLFNDIFVHAGYASHVVHNLQTLWIFERLVHLNVYSFIT